MQPTFEIAACLIWRRFWPHRPGVVGGARCLGWASFFWKVSRHPKAVAAAANRRRSSGETRIGPFLGPAGQAAD